MNRGEVWWLRLDHGTPKTAVRERLVLILSTDALAVLPLRLVVPLVAWREDFHHALAGARATGAQQRAGRSDGG